MSETWLERIYGAITGTVGAGLFGYFINKKKVKLENINAEQDIQDKIEAKRKADYIELFTKCEIQDKKIGILITELSQMKTENSNLKREIAKLNFKV